MKKLINGIKRHFLQFILSGVAITSWIMSYSFGLEYAMGNIPKSSDDTYQPTSVTAGYDGGAISMGIICSVCIIMIVWIEINKSKFSKTPVSRQKSEPLDKEQLTNDPPQKQEMNEKEKINELVKWIGLVGSKTYSDLIICTNGTKSEFNDVTKLEAEISALMKFDYLVAGQQVSLDFREEFHRVSIEYLYHQYKDKVLNKNLSDLIENRYVKYGEILVNAGEKWHQNLIEEIISILQDSKNKMKMEEVYPLDLTIGFTDDSEFKMKFIKLEIESLYIVKKIIDDIFGEKNPREIIPSNNADSTDFPKNEERQMKHTTIDPSKVSESTKERGRKMLEAMRERGPLLDKVGQTFVITKSGSPKKEQ